MAQEIDHSKTSVTLQGIGVSPGVVIAPVFLADSAGPHVVERRIAPEQYEHEVCRLEEALIETRRQIRQIQADLAEWAAMTDASIFDAHLMVLDDRSFIEEVLVAIREQLINVEAAVKRVADRYVSVFESVGDDYLRERVADVKDVVLRILRNLSGGEGVSVASLKEKRIVVAVDLSPSDTAVLRKNVVAGFVTDLGSPTSHTAVMARALEIPAIVGLRDITTRVRNGDEVLIDGNKGVMIIHPSAAQLEEYGRLDETRRTIERGLGSLQHQPAETVDGHRIVLSANAEGLEDLETVLHYGAEGIGLFRSEYLYLAADRMVTEDEQFEVYEKAAAKLAPAPVIVRTLDVGGDKLFRRTRHKAETNPFLGCRSIRLSLQHPDIFKVQLRAILRASTRGNVKLMYPLISRVDEVIRANRILEDCKQELIAEGIPFDRQIDVGIMVEVPSAALSADILAKHVNFFSIGTNDLVQYTLAVDRVNERVAYLYEPTNPAVLKLIKMTVDAAHRHNLWVGLCGEMAADPLLAPLLIGMGLDELSMAPSAVPWVKDAIRSVDYKRACLVAEKGLALESAAEVLQMCRELTQELAPELLELI